MQTGCSACRGRRRAPLSVQTGASPPSRPLRTHNYASYCSRRCARARETFDMEIETYSNRQATHCCEATERWKINSHRSPVCGPASSERARARPDRVFASFFVFNIKHNMARTHVDPIRFRWCSRVTARKTMRAQCRETFKGVGLLLLL